MSGAFKQTHFPPGQVHLLLLLIWIWRSVKPKRLSQVGFCGKPSLNLDLFVWKDSLKQQDFRDFDVHWLDISET